MLCHTHSLITPTYLPTYNIKYGERHTIEPLDPETYENQKGTKSNVNWENKKMKMGPLGSRNPHGTIRVWGGGTLANGGTFFKI